MSGIKCLECGSQSLRWNCASTSNNQVADGRLRISDVDTTFYLGCEYCSATISSISGDEVAALMPILLPQGGTRD